MTTFICSNIQTFLVIQFAEQSTAELYETTTMALAGIYRKGQKIGVELFYFILKYVIHHAYTCTCNNLGQEKKKKKKKENRMWNVYLFSLLGLFLHTSQQLCSCQDVATIFSWSSILHYDVMTCETCFKLISYMMLHFLKSTHYIFG